jgi:predicted dehydrogenase
MGDGRRRRRDRRRQRVRHEAGLLLDFGDACFAAVDASFCMPYLRGPRYEFYGYQGAIQFSEGSGVELISERPEFAAPDPEKPVQWHSHPLPDDRRPGEKLKWGPALARHVRHCLETGARPLCPGEHARHVVEIMERAQDAARTGRTQELTSEASPTLS